MLIADGDEGRKAQVLAALDDFRHPADRDDLVLELGSVVESGPRRPIPLISVRLVLHLWFSFGPDLKNQAALAHGLGQSFDPAVVGVNAPVEDDLLDIPGFEPLGHDFAELFAAGQILGVLELGPEIFFQSTGRGDHGTRVVVDRLGVNVPVAFENKHPGPVGGPADFPADSLPKSLVPFGSDFDFVFMHRLLPPSVLS
jgi:hypothetical protein